MSDRVAIIGGSVEGRDHFPFPVPDPDDPVPTFQYQRGISLGAAVKWFYLVKTWKLTGTFSWNTNDGAYEGTFHDLALAKHYTGTAEAATESDLVVSLGISDIGSVDSTWGCTFVSPNPGETPYFDAFGISVFDQFTDPWMVYGTPDTASGYNLYPKLGFGFLVTGVSGDNGIEMGFSDDVGLPQPSGHFTIDSDIEYDVRIISTGPGVIGIPHIDLSLVPVEYWPYAAKDGTPIYASDGTQLQSPFN